MTTVNQYDLFRLTKNINVAITQGMPGVVLEIWNDNCFEVEFVKKDGTNYEFYGQSTFTVDKFFIGELIKTNKR